MANEISTAGIKVYYAVETTAGTQPTTFSTEIPDITSIPAMDSAPEGLDCTPLSEPTWRRYCQGLKDPGSDFAMTANDTTTFRTAWEGLITAAATGKASGKATWYKIQIPNRPYFAFSGDPAPLGMNGYEVNNVAQLQAHITPTKVAGWVAS